MQRSVIIIIIILIALGIIKSLAVSFLPDDSDFITWYRNSNWIHQLFYFFGIAKSGLILYHFGSQKKWFIVVTFAALILISFIGEMFLKSVLTRDDNSPADFAIYISVMRFTGYAIMICELLYGVACIVEGTRKFAWLMYFGIATVVISLIVQALNMMDDPIDFGDLFRLIFFIPPVFLIIYFVKRLSADSIKVSPEIIDDGDGNMRSHLTTMFEKADRSEEDATSFLIAKGYDRDQASAFAKEVSVDVKNKKVTGATKDLVFGGIWCIGGIIVTAASYSAAGGGGSYVIAYGAIIIGAIQFIRGLSRLF